MKKIYGIYDSKSKFYPFPPLYLRNRGEAIRMFGDLANDKTIAIGKHPEDYCLFELGEYDEEHSLFQNTPPESLGVALEFVQKETMGSQALR